MTAPKNPIMKAIIDEMVNRIHNEEANIFIATGPTLFTDVIYNYINNTSIYDTKTNVTDQQRELCFLKNRNFMNGLIIDDQCDKFLFGIPDYNHTMLYNDMKDKYIVTFNSPTPLLYK